MGKESKSVAGKQGGEDEVCQQIPQTPQDTHNLGHYGKITRVGKAGFLPTQVLLVLFIVNIFLKKPAAPRSALGRLFLEVPELGILRGFVHFCVGDLIWSQGPAP